MTPEELAARWPVGSRWRRPSGVMCEVVAHCADEEFPLIAEDIGAEGKWALFSANDWTRIDAPEPVAEGDTTAKLLAYQHAHEQAVSMGYASLTEALEALEPTPAPDDGLRERAALAIYVPLIVDDHYSDDQKAAGRAWKAAAAFIAAKGTRS